VPDLEMGNKYIILTIKEYPRCHFASIIALNGSFF
jgi:hypothetical protein